ncbi:MAG TPA: hypothetical protein VKH17_03475 [Acidimicrobiia bacterium]|nr:hypothetical protein [Acidimicrobiia bacterium]HMF83509.1 hypothetical protein [Acidimicrobiia bacterium]
MAEYTQTHVVPTEGLPAWAGPDGSVAPAANLDPGLDVMLLDRRGEWAYIRCSNGWEAWVDGRRLMMSASAPSTAWEQAPAPAPPPSANAPPTPAPTDTVATAPPAQPGPPPAARGASAAGARPGAGGFRIGPGQIVALVGGFVFFVSSWMQWLHVSVSFGRRSASISYSSYKIPAHFLVDSQSNQGGLGLGILIAFLGVACIAGALLSGLRQPLGILTIVAGGVSFVVMVLFFVQTSYAIDALPASFEKGYFSVLRYGAIIAMLGAIGVLTGGILSLSQKRS